MNPRNPRAGSGGAAPGEARAQRRPARRLEAGELVNCADPDPRAGRRGGDGRRFATALERNAPNRESRAAIPPSEEQLQRWREEYHRRRLRREDDLSRLRRMHAELGVEVEALRQKLDVAAKEKQGWLHEEVEYVKR
ncbi:hypothetical protein HK405_003471 [Cladochytrium tenue]|nr:hypothetical protein HK405_003471 [Cladochytrium tenue]